MNKEVLTRKEKERLFKRAEIMDAAVGIFAKKGYRDTTLDEIAISSEFGKGTIYNYFKSKEEIYSAIIEEVSKSLYQIIQEADSASKSSTEFFKMHSRLLFQYCAQKRFDFLIYVREIAHFTTDIFITERDKINERHAKIKAILIKNITKGMKIKEIKKFDIEKIAILYEHMIFPYIIFLINTFKDKFDQDKEIDFILSVFYNGIINKN